MSFLYASSWRALTPGPGALTAYSSMNQQDKWEAVCED